MAKKKTTSKETGITKVKILAGNVAGKYHLSYKQGEVVELEAKQAEELINAGDAKEVK